MDPLLGYARVGLGGDDTSGIWVAIVSRETAAAYFNPNLMICQK